MLVDPIKSGGEKEASLSTCKCLVLILSLQFRSLVSVCWCVRPGSIPGGRNVVWAGLETFLVGKRNASIFPTSEPNRGAYHHAVGTQPPTASAVVGTMRRFDAPALHPTFGKPCDLIPTAGENKRDGMRKALWQIVAECLFQSLS